MKHYRRSRYRLPDPVPKSMTFEELCEYHGIDTCAVVASGGKIIPNKTVTHTIPLLGGESAYLTMPQPISPENVAHVRRWFDLMEKALSTAAGEKETAR